MMTNIFFVRHALPLYSCTDTTARPLTEEGMRDAAEVVRTLRYIRLDHAVSSPYKRSIDTIKKCAQDHCLNIETDIRLRERDSGKNSNNMEMFKKRWSDLDYSEPDGECIRSVMERNIAAVEDILDNYSGDNIIVGTHGTALSTILHYYDNSFGLQGFLRIIDYMPYIIRLGFDGRKCVEKEELLIIEKEFGPVR